ncbi:ATPase [Duganella sp. Leaf126]|uniref:AAA family ATPase n=1 Tax=Duganella sp. Leaf126 TaxID=1736266 RepID=UPI0006F824BB|nr:AAA family ATPase [Duganella sp. Leaf126]KQQ31877.1 ATPase [Duganella sp. Leaf126]
MKPFHTGLVVGKFSPLHLGHELLIGRAMAACEQVVIIAYSQPELPGCSSYLREQWLRTRFPHATVLVLHNDRHDLPDNDADATVHRRLMGWACLHLLGRPVDAVFTSEDYGDGFAAELTRYFARHGHRRAPVRHVLVDQARRLVPVSGTAIRQDPHAHRAFLSAPVYASYVQTVCFLGGESSGKSTLAQAMAAACRTVWAPEYGRELWEARGGELAYEDLLHIAQVQQQREDDLRPLATRYLFCDTSTLTTLFYSREMFGRAEPELEHRAGRQYDHVFVCVPDFAFVQDGTRRDDSFRLHQHAWYITELQRRNIAYTLLIGPPPQRIATVLQHLS